MTVILKEYLCNKFCYFLINLSIDRDSIEIPFNEIAYCFKLFFEHLVVFLDFSDTQNSYDQGLVLCDVVLINRIVFVVDFFDQVLFILYKLTQNIEDRFEQLIAYQRVQLASLVKHRFNFMQENYVFF